MAYRFNAGQPVPDEVRRVFFEEIDSAVKQLTKHKDEDRDERIHEARKSIKKLRGVLRLVKPLIGKRIYRRENQALGDVGRKLSELRDARAIIEIFEAVIKETETRKAIDNDLTRSIRDRLEAHKSETEQKVNVEETLSSAIAALQTVRSRANDYQLTKDGFEGLERGLKDIYRRGRKAMKQAAKTPTAENFHDWRKRVKDHWYHVRLLSSLDTAFLKTREDDLRKLETWLGDDHNLVVLRETIDNDRASFRHPRQVRQFLAITKQHGQALRGKALALGEHLYGLKPKQFVKELAQGREIWPAESSDVHAGTNNLTASPSDADQRPNSSELQTASLQTADDGSGHVRRPRKGAGSALPHQSRTKARA